MNRRRFLGGAVAAAFAGPPAVRAAMAAAPASRPGEELLGEVPAFEGNVILARPTDRSISVSVMSRKAVSAYVAFGPAGGAMARATPVFELAAGEPRLVVLEGLEPGARYDFELRTAGGRGPLWGAAGGGGSFRTAPGAGAAFVFTVQADSHLDGGTRRDVYERCLKNQVEDGPDFVVDLGDTFMTGKHATREAALRQYLAQRYYFGLVGHRAPPFLLVGNHDGEEAKLRGATDVDGLAVWSATQRKRFFANPEPDGFYTGNETPQPHVGSLEDYYAFTWGDALLVALDPYWTSRASRGGSGGWNMSLGKAQYDWLARTLRQSGAKHKMVFIHQLVGGTDDAGRGGAEAAGLYEWGGREADGRDTFARNRPGWAMPIHRLLIETGVKLVFHGHDHFYARQERDGITYQLVPQPGHRNWRTDHAAEYGYKDGTFLPNSGHLRVSVGPGDVGVEYVRASVPTRPDDPKNGSVAAAYKVPGR